MKLEQDIFLLITKHVDGKTSPKEKQFLKDWMSKEENAADYIILKEIWNDKREDDLDLTSFNALNELIKKIDAQESYTEEQLNEVPRKNKINSRVPVLTACAVFMIGLFVFLPFALKKAPTTEVYWIEKTVSNGEMAELLLSDGTRVVLNAGCTFKYPDKFSDNVREVFLEGEAYFEVEKNPLKPFLIKTGKLTTKVLGTSFNVSAYPNDKDIKISLQTGKVEILQTKGEEPILKLNPGEELTFDKSKNIYVKSTFDYLTRIGWKDNVLKFEGTTLKQVFKQLERKYNVHFELENQMIENCKLTALFEAESITNIMKAINEAGNFKYKKYDQKIIIYGSGCDPVQ